MCGIAGIYDIRAGSLTPEIIRKMTDRIVHRGPDGEGQWLNPNAQVGLGHRRLSIIDLSEGGAQPMHFKDRYSITFNGEIYNYLELKERLQEAGYQFQSASDTEVLLAMYDSKKEACLQELDGMFAFVIWDEQEKRLFCARDRFGEKPFHYHWNGERFCFASEIKALFAAGVPQRISRKNMEEFLLHYLISGKNETFFEDIFVLEQGHYLSIQEGNLTIERYYDIDLKKKAASDHDEGYALKFRELFKRGLKRRLRSDVPIGSSLSGGLDSSSVVCFVRDIIGPDANQQTFSARFTEGRDEGQWIDQVVLKAKTKHHDIYPESQEVSQDIQKMIYHLEYPFGSFSISASWFVMKRVSEEGVKVVLDGQGADEYLAGYPVFKNYLLMQYLAQGKWRRFVRARKAYRKLYGQQYPLGKMLWAHPLLALIKHPRGAFYHARTFKQRLKYETFHRLQELLSNADRVSMAFGVEVRLPFLYHELVEYGFSLPDEQLYHDGTTKYVLRNAIRGIVPDAIVERKDKIGYEAPQHAWMDKLYDEASCKNFLTERQYTPCEDGWRNYIACEFIKCFES
ncbi:MAG: asparagine synthase (glutamine-hydrolyzing) [Bacteroidetes bacterium]|nr:MAG: asparagine synthase (glutamine-hydrolyzing) [Bacteroidota bacterium]